MKNLIIQAIDEAFVVLEKQIPQTKNQIELISIKNVSPLDLVNFMKENNIPNDAYFSYDDKYNEICLSYDVDVPTTDEYKLKFKRERFTRIAWRFVFDSLTKSGYKRVGFNSGFLNEFKDTTVYDMFINSDFDRLIKYYSLFFINE